MIICPFGNAQSFVKSSEKYEDLKSSGYTLIITSAAGFIFMVLKALDLIPLYFQGFSEYMFYIVMGAMFAAFMITGIMSLRKAGKIKGKIATEENTSNSIIEFITENYNAEKIDSEINASALPDGEIYYKRYDYIKNIIDANFENIDEAFSEHLVEEAYQDIYETD